MPTVLIKSPLRRAQAALAGVEIEPSKRDVLLTIAGQLADWQGHTANPQTGCALLETSLGDATVWIEYEHTFGEESQTSGPPERCYEGSPDETIVLQVLINGQWIDTDVFSEEQIERWQEAAAEDARQRAQYERDEYEINRYESARDYA